MATAALGLQRLLQVGTKIVGVGRNYAAHAKELGNAVPDEPVLFLKPTSSYLNARSRFHILWSRCITRWSSPSLLARELAMDYVGGYALALDMTAREIQASAKAPLLVPL